MLKKRNGLPGQKRKIAQGGTKSARNSPGKLSQPWGENIRKIMTSKKRCPDGEDQKQRAAKPFLKGARGRKDGFDDCK